MRDFVLPIETRPQPLRALPINPVLRPPVSVSRKNPFNNLGMLLLSIMHKENSPSLSAILITKNESLNIEECVRSVRFCNEVIVLDSGSTDDTVLKAKALGCEVIQTTDWPGYGLQKQRGINHATSQWILSIDADERVTLQLQEEILDAIKMDIADGYRIKRRSFFLERWMSFGGWYPDYVLRLARREKCKFDSSLVHEKMMVNGELRNLKHPLLHHAYLSIDDVLEKQKRYALLGAETIHRRYPHEISILTALGHSLWTFFRLYILQCGVLDGRAGFISATAKSQETFWKYIAARYQSRKSSFL